MCSYPLTKTSLQSASWKEPVARPTPSPPQFVAWTNAQIPNITGEKKPLTGSGKANELIGGDPLIPDGISLTADDTTKKICGVPTPPNVQFRGRLVSFGENEGLRYSG